VRLAAQVAWNAPTRSRKPARLIFVIGLLPEGDGLDGAGGANTDQHAVGSSPTAAQIRRGPHVVSHRRVVVRFFASTTGLLGEPVDAQSCGGGRGSCSRQTDTDLLRRTITAAVSVHQVLHDRRRDSGQPGGRGGGWRCSEARSAPTTGQSSVEAPHRSHALVDSRDVTARKTTIAANERRCFPGRPAPSAPRKRVSDWEVRGQCPLKSVHAATVHEST